jgi:hypothetical protein
MVAASVDRRFFYRWVEQLEGGVIIGKAAAGLDDLAKQSDAMRASTTAISFTPWALSSLTTLSQNLRFRGPTRTACSDN